MAKNKKRNYIKKTVKQNDNWYLLEHERKGLLEHYDFIECSYKFPRGKRTLICDGHYNQLGVEYRYQISYDGGIPKAHIIQPKIEYDIDCHMFSDNSLCLYYHGDERWSTRKSLYTHFVPWVHEWILYYEIYKLSGKWEHPFVHHGNKEQNKN